MEKNNLNKSSNAYGTIRLTFALIAAITGALSFLFLLTYGIEFGTATVGYAYARSECSMGALIFGTQDWATGPNPGLLSAFIIMVCGIGLSLGMIKNDFCGYLAILFFITSAVLWFCTVPLYGNMSAKLSTAGYCLGVFNIVDAVLVFIGVNYR